MIYFNLFWGFLEVGLFSFGGAYAAIPLIRDVVMHYGWIDDESLTYMIAVSESTPGPLMVNMATYIGSSVGGLFGALLATFAVVLPAFIIIILMVLLLKGLLDNPYMQAVLRGVKPCIMGIILAIGADMFIRNVVVLDTGFAIDKTAAFLSLGLMVIYHGSGRIKKGGISPILLICIAAALGIMVY
jgi:chromate transporter